MRASSQKDLSVYDFDEKEEAVEALSGRYRSRFDANRTKTDDSMDKYNFLQAFTSRLNFGQKDVTEVSCIDLCEKDNARVSRAVDLVEGNLTLVEEKSDSDEITAPSLNSHEHGQICQDEFEHGTRANSLLIGASNLVLPSVAGEQFSEPPSDGTPEDMISDNEESWASDSRSPSTSVSDLSENEGLLGRQVLHYTAFGEAYDSDMAVIVSPDYVIYGKTIYGGSQLTFFSDCIKIECSDASVNDEKFVLEWTVADIIHINCQWIECAEVAYINLCLKATPVAGTKKVHDDCDIVKLMFTVTGTQWLDKEQKIKSLAARYNDIWIVRSDDDLVSEDGVMEPNMFFSKHYFTEITEPFEDVIYPKGDPDAVSISKRDIELLQPDTFINDTIIDFYIKYLKNKIQPCQKDRFHFFNSFFFRKLADLDKDPGSASEGRVAFQRVRKWTRKVNLFEKDYVFIPVNFNLHWSLLVICHPGEIVTSKDVALKESPRVPCILHMDSIKGSHNGLRTLIQSYLREEWKERHPESSEDNLSKFSDLRFVSLELPQQENSFDCGLFLLHYVELFLEKAPANFNPFKITKFSRFLTADWFIPGEASHKRSFIRKLIYDLLKDPSRELNPIPHSSGHLSSGFPEKDTKQEPALDFLSENRSAAKAEFDDSAVSDSGIEIKLLPSSPGVAQCDNQGPVLREFLPPRSTADSFNECRAHSFQLNGHTQKPNCTRCQMEEYADTSKQLVSTCLHKDDCQPINVNHSEQICSTSHPPKDVGSHEMAWCSMQEKGGLRMDCSLDSLNSDHLVSNQKDVTEKPRSSMENFGYVPDSPTTSYGEKTENCVKNYQDIDTAKAKGGDCEDSQGDNTTKVNCDGEDCHVFLATKSEGRGDENCQDTNTPKSEGVNAKDHLEGRGGENCQDTNTPKSEGVNAKDHLDTYTVKVDIVDCQEIDTTKVEGGEGECQKIDAADASGGGSDGPSCPPHSPPTQSFQDIVSSDDESPLNKDDSQKRKDEPDARLEQQPLKRRKLMLLEGGRRHTRSCARNCPP